MPDLQYLDFDLDIERAPNGYRVEITRSPAGNARAEFILPFSDLEIENVLLKLGGARRRVRRIESAEMDAAKQFGGKLFNAVFTGDVRGVYAASLAEANTREVGLRLRLHFDNTPELADLPWEFLYNPALNRFLALSVKTPIVRFLELPENIRPLTIHPPLRILVMISSPTDYEQLDVEREWQHLKTALGDLEQRGLLTLERLERASLSELRRKLQEREYHIFHFIGHGGFDERAQDGELILENEAQRGRRVSAQTLGAILHDHGSLRLAVLNACEGARTSRSDPFAGVASSLVQQGIPAVIAMQFEISDDAAATFASGFYQALAHGYPVDAALSEVRKTIFADNNEMEWGTPVLYLRAPDGKIFDVHQKFITSQPLAPTTISTSEERVFDASLPTQVVVGEQTELLTMIRLADSPGLAKLIRDEIQFEKHEGGVRSKAMRVDFPIDRVGNTTPLDLWIRVEAPGFELRTATKRIRILFGYDSEPVVFLLTPRQAGELEVVVSVYREQDVLIKTNVIRVSSSTRLERRIKTVRKLVTISLGTFSRKAAGIHIGEGTVSVGGDMVGGDKYVGNIDGDTISVGRDIVQQIPAPPAASAQVAIGRNILQAKLHIGSLVIPVGFIAVLVALALIGAFALWIFSPRTPAPTPTPTIPPPTFPGPIPNPGQLPTDINIGSGTLIPPTVPDKGSTSQASTAQNRGNDNAPMVFVPAGEFTMGSNQGEGNERPVHQVFLNAFWIDQHEVTNAQYEQCVEASKCSFPSAQFSSTRTSYYGNPQFDNYPVLHVPWDDARNYCEWAGKHLPTEAEWEKAARGTDARIYPWGNEFDASKLNSKEDDSRDTTQVGNYPNGASPYGALDMAGNVWEWVADWFDSNYYASSPRANPTGAPSGQNRVIRGGGWIEERFGARTSFRGMFAPDFRGYALGFRCAQ